MWRAARPVARPGRRARSSSPARPSTSRCRRAYAARIRFPRPEIPVALAVGPCLPQRRAAILEQEPPADRRSASSGSRTWGTSHAAKAGSSRASWAVPGRGGLAPHGAAVGRDAQDRRPRADVRLLDGPDDRVARASRVVAGPIDDAREPRGVGPVLDPGKRHRDVEELVHRPGRTGLGEAVETPRVLDRVRSRL